MKRLLVVLFVCFFTVSAFAAETEWFKGSFEAAKAEAAKQDKLVLMLFYSSG